MQHPAGDRAKPPVACGLDRLVAERFARLRGRRVGLVTHPAAVDARLRDAASLFAAAPDVTLVAIFGPEHGFCGQAQDLESVPEHAVSALPAKVHSLYGTSAASLRPTPEQLAGIDLLVIDLQDVGSRYYTFQATMKYCLEAAAPLNLPVLVLDRPNPLGGAVVEGPRLRPGYESFVGCHDIAIRHGLTIGELALAYQADLKAAGTQVAVEVLPCSGWRRTMWFDDTASDPRSGFRPCRGRDRGRSRSRRSPGTTRRVKGQATGPTRRASRRSGREPRRPLVPGQPAGIMKVSPFHPR